MSQSNTIELTILHQMTDSSNGKFTISAYPHILNVQHYYYSICQYPLSYCWKTNWYNSYGRLEQAMKQDWMQNHGPKQTKKTTTTQQKSNLSEGLLWLFFAIFIWPAMLIFIMFAGIMDIVLFILTMGLCFGKCKQPKRTWFSYSCVRGATKCTSEMLKKICNYLTTYSCCCCCYLTIPIGFVLVVLGFILDVIAWILTGFYWWGYCCPTEKFLEWSLGRRALFNLKRCFQRVLDCD